MIPVNPSNKPTIQTGDVIENFERFTCEQDYIVMEITSLCAACDTLRLCCD